MPPAVAASAPKPSALTPAAKSLWERIEASEIPMPENVAKGGDAAQRSWQSELREAAYHCVGSVEHGGRLLDRCRSRDGSHRVLDGRTGLVMAMGPIPAMFAWDAAIAKHEHWRTRPLPPEHIERHRLKSMFPAVAATLPPLGDPYAPLPSPLGSLVAKDWRNVLLDLRRTSVDDLVDVIARFARGDFGSHGTLTEGRATLNELTRWAPELGDGWRTYNALAIEAGSGLVWGRYPLPPSTVARLMASRGPGGDPPRGHADVLAWSAGDGIFNLLATTTTGDESPF